MSSTCRVSFTDGADVTHTVTVSASSLYEAAILRIAEFKKSGFAFGGISSSTRIKIAVQPPPITHELSVAKVQAWLERNGKTPRASQEGHAAAGALAGIGIDSGENGTRRDGGVGNRK